MVDLIANFNLSGTALGYLTSAVQLGFIIGTLLFAVLTIVDRFSPSKVFLTCAVLGALFNTSVTLEENSLLSLLCLRFLTGFFLAGIYPVGMKIAADYYKKGLGKSLGFLVGALVIGTAFPHLLKGILTSIPWKYVIFITSLLAILGGFLMAILIPNGPYRKAGDGIDISAFIRVFKNSNFRSASFGYFGHMWELYTFWAFVPIMLQTYNELHPKTTFNIPVLSFLIIGIGGISCILAGYISQITGTKRTAFIVLLLSCACCLISPFIFTVPSESIFVAFLLFWGMVVIADSPLFATLVAQSASSKIKGTALTIVNSIGFSITIISIQTITYLKELIDSNSIYFLLSIGPILGLIALSVKGSDTERS